jgi:hypothetical protein
VGPQRRPGDAVTNVGRKRVSSHGFSTLLT